MGRKISKLQYKKRKEEAYHLTKLLYYFLRHHPDNIYFEKIKGNVVGYYDRETQEITIDYRKDIVPTLIHEFIHHMHPTWCESKVVKKEKEMMMTLTPKQCKNIMKHLMKCL